MRPEPNYCILLRESPVVAGQQPREPSQPSGGVPASGRRAEAGA